MLMIREFAPAKLNLYLHVTGRKPDGYHILDSLVAFAGAGDEIRLEPARKFIFEIEGPRADALRGESADSNLVVRCAKSLAENLGKPLDVKLALIKNLPVASGIGGGSSDAAAALRALASHWGITHDDPRLYEAARKHGQDIAVCLRVENCYMRGDDVAKGPVLPHCPIVLVNPGKPLPTADVYKARQGAFSPAAPFDEIPQDPATLAAMLKERTNDLAEAACRLMPEIEEILATLSASRDCLLARMSGSGASCFAIYPDRDSARCAAAEIFTEHPNWWVTQSHLPWHPDPRKRH